MIVAAWLLSALDPFASPTRRSAEVAATPLLTLAASFAAQSRHIFDGENEHAALHHLVFSSAFGL